MPLVAEGRTHPTLKQEQLSAYRARRGDPCARRWCRAVGRQLTADYGENVISDSLAQTAELFAPRAISTDADGEEERITGVAHDDYSSLR